MNTTKLKFAKGNAKLGKQTAIFSLPAGYTCPGAMNCLSRANRETGKVTDGPDTLFRCYAANTEVMFRNVRVSRWNNFELLKGKSIAEMVALIVNSIPKKIVLCRIHASGDFFSQAYFDAWVEVARQLPHVIFYAYTKALPFWIYRINNLDGKQFPNNLKLVASKGGKFDNLIALHGLRYVEVVYSNEQAEKLGLPIDNDDSLAWKSQSNFALLLHGTQPAGSVAGQAWQKIKKEQGGYKSDYFAHYEKSGKVSANRKLQLANKN